MRIPSALLVAALCACATTGRPPPPLAPLRAEGEVHVFALPPPREADRLDFTIERVALRRADGGEVPLEVALPEIAAAGLRDQRLLAWGRVPPGEYAGLAVKAGAATVGQDGERSRLLVDEDPSFVELALRIDPGTAAVAWVALRPGESIRRDFGFAPVFTGMLAPQTPPQVALYCTNLAGASVTAVDRRSRLVTGLIPVGEAPRGIALDAAASRAYVALSREDQVEVLDVAANASLERIRLTPGDEPTELAFAADGTLVVLNERSRSVSFVDPVAMAELGRVPVGDVPTALLVDRSGRRAYVANRASATITVIDLPNRAVFATVAVDAEPLRMALSRDGGRLYVVHRGSADLTVLALPSLAPEPPAYVGLGVTTILVDARSDLIYLSRGEERRIAVYDPIALQPVDQFDVPGAVSYMAIDDAEDALLMLMPDRRSIAVVDLTSRRPLAEIPVGASPYELALAGERF